MKRWLFISLISGLFFSAQAQSFPPLTDFVLGRAEASGATITFTLQNSSPCTLDEVYLRVLHNGIYKTFDAFSLVTLLPSGETGQFIKTLSQVVNDDWNWTIDRVLVSNPRLNPECSYDGDIELEFIDFGPPLATPPSATATVTTTQTQTATAISGSGSHTVERGDTLYNIAQRYGTTVSAIQQANNRSTTVLTLGDVLRIPGASSAAPVGTVSGSDFTTHIVQSGDNLWSLADTYGTTVTLLQAANCLHPGMVLQLGQSLRIPAPNVNDLRAVCN